MAILRMVAWAARRLVGSGAEEGEEEEGDPGGGEEFGVCAALEGREEHVGVGEVEGGGDQGGVGARELAG